MRGDINATLKIIVSILGIGVIVNTAISIMRALLPVEREREVITRTVQVGDPHEEADYTIFQKDGVAYAKNGDSGDIELQGDVASVVQGAIDALSAKGGGKVFIKPGIYEVNSTIFLKENVSLEGVPYATELRGTLDAPIIKIDTQKRVSIKNLIIADPTLARLPGSRGIQIINSERVDIENIWTYGFEIGIEISASSPYQSHVDLVHVQATDGKEGIVIYGAVDQVRLINPRVFANTVRGIRLDTLTMGIARILEANIQNPGANQSIYIVNCDNNSVIITGGVIAGDEVRGMEISSNTAQIIINSFEVLASRQEGIYVYDTDNIIIANTDVRDCSKEGAGLYSGIVLDNTSNAQLLGIRVTGANHKYDIEERGDSDANLIIGVFNSVYRLGTKTEVISRTYMTMNKGIATITGDGSTTEFTIEVPHGLVSDKVAVSVSSTRATTAPPNYIFAYLVDKDGDGFKETIVITVRFDTAPADGETVEIYWRAEVVG